MGHGSVSSRRFQPDRPLSLYEQLTKAKNDAMQLRAERDFYQRKCEQLSITIAVRDRQLAHYENTFGFKTPNTEQPELQNQPGA